MTSVAAMIQIFQAQVIIEWFLSNNIGLCTIVVGEPAETLAVAWVSDG